MAGELQKTNYVLGAFMIAIVLGSIAQLIYYITKSSRRSKPIVLLFVLVCCHAVVRSVYNYIPSAVYGKLLKSKQGPTKLMALDLLPETIFLVMFWLLVCTWMDTFVRIKMWKNKIKRVFWLVFPIGCAIILISLIITISASTRRKYKYIEIAQQEYYYIVTFIAVIMGGALIFGALVYKIFAEAITKPGESANRKLNSFLKLVIIASVSLIVKAIYLGAMSYYKRAAGELTEYNFSIIWFFYFSVTEMMPSIAILSVFVDNQRQGKNISEGPTTGNEVNMNTLPSFSSINSKTVVSLPESV